MERTSATFSSDIARQYLAKTAAFHAKRRFGSLCSHFVLNPERRVPVPEAVG
jgi:hypothetical protein